MRTLPLCSSVVLPALAAKTNSVLSFDIGFMVDQYLLTVSR